MACTLPIAASGHDHQRYVQRTVAVGALAMLGGLVSCSGPTPAASVVSHTAQPSASIAAVPIPPLTATFRSPLMGYSVRYAADWTPTPATQLWGPLARNFWDDPVGDRLESATAGFRGTSQALAPGQSAAAWLTAYLGSGPACGVPEQVTVAGSTGTLDMNGCSGNGRLHGRVFDFAIVAGGRGYNFTMEGAVDHALFMAMLATVVLTPDSAATPTPSG